MMKYSPHKTEKKHQERWEKAKAFECLRDRSRPKFYALSMFPYPSGAGLHIGHLASYTPSDAIARYKRARGFNVLHPFGYDAFGLPAEQYAVQTGVHPEKITLDCINKFRRQLKAFGFSFDWSREISTCDPSYYKWTQWMFKIFLRRGLARQTEAPVNWCPALRTVLANEEVIDGKSERGGHPVIRKPMKQWTLRITEYAERLLKDLDDIDWPERTKTAQRNWIGRSEGAEILFPALKSSQTPDSPCKTKALSVFTTRPDTIFGATFAVIAPEHPLLQQLVSPDRAEAVRAFQEACQGRSELSRKAKAASKAPQPAAGRARNPEQDPNWQEERQEQKSGAEDSAQRKERPDLAAATPRLGGAADENEESERKSGVFTGCRLLNPATKEIIPLYTADYVMMGYGTGAIMAVPAHDERDFAFAKAFGLPVKKVVKACNPKGPNPKGPNPEGHNPKGPNPEGHNPEGHNPEGHNPEGHNPESRDPENSNLLQSGKPSGDKHLRADPEREAPAASADPAAKKSPAGGGALSEAFEGDGPHIHSASADGKLNLNGLGNEAAKKEVTAWLQKEGHGKKTVQYKLRDWLFSRQRYWGEPFPVIKGLDGAEPVPDEDLPVLLPPAPDYQPSEEGESPLKRLKKFVHCTDSKGWPAERETDTMPGSAGSSWYFLRYLDPRNKKAPFDFEEQKYWTPVDLYIGGAEHSTGHLLYARFWHKVLYDEGLVSHKEPFQKLAHQGVVLGEDGFRMSKSRGNGVDPDPLREKYGADAVRVYLCFLGPFEKDKPWSAKGIEGSRRFLERLHRFALASAASPQEQEMPPSQPASPSKTEKRRSKEEPPPQAADLKPDIPRSMNSLLHQTIKKVTEDIESMRFNTAISALMTFLNHLERENIRDRATARILARLIMPFAPHLAEEMGEICGEKGLVSLAKWPEWDSRAVQEDTVSIGVQVQGKARGAVSLPAKAGREEASAAALKSHRVRQALAGKTVKRTIYVPGKIINLLTD